MDSFIPAGPREKSPSCIVGSLCSVGCSSLVTLSLVRIVFIPSASLAHHRSSPARAAATAFSRSRSFRLTAPCLCVCVLRFLCTHLHTATYSAGVPGHTSTTITSRRQCLHILSGAGKDASLAFVWTLRKVTQSIPSIIYCQSDVRHSPAFFDFRNNSMT